MGWSAAARSVWGKTDPANQMWLPVVQHLEDTAAMADYLFQFFLPPATKALLCQFLETPVEDEVRVIVRWMAALHDIGKMTREFTSQARAIMPSVVGAMRDYGLNTDPPLTTFGHHVLGQAILRDWLENRYGTSRRVANTYACIAGGHHGRNPSRLTLQDAQDTPQNLGSGAWQAVRDEVLAGMTSLTGAEKYVAGWVQRPLALQAQTLVTAVVIVADWMASNQDLFPYLDDHDASARVRAAVHTLRLPQPWAPTIPGSEATSLLHRRFPCLTGEARSVQQALMTTSLTMDETGLIILEAPMGVGKTEASLMAAECIASRFGHGGIFFGLPTMATANPMFDRILSWLGTAVGSHDASISLAHGKAGLNDTYAGLLRSAWHGSVYDEEGTREGRAVVNGWLRGRKRAGLASFVVGTIDQGLFGALKAKHLVLRHLALAGKVVIIDEVHAADEYMRHYLRSLLSWLGSYRTPVILMSATLPPWQRDEFVQAYALGRGDHHPPATDRVDTYPRITTYPAGVGSPPISIDGPATRVQLTRIADNPETVRDLLMGLLEDGGCAGVLCNTVGRAQETYRVLRGAFGADVELAHSRRVAPDRIEHEASLVARLGYGGERPHRLVVVGTQVLEQSLDIDFDVMISDIAPMDLVLQRVGRLHRHVRSRPDNLASPTLYVRGVVDWGESPISTPKGARAIYGAASLLRSAALVSTRDYIDLPGDIPRLVRLAYDPGFRAPDGWAAAWDAAAQGQATAVEKIRRRASTYLLGSPLVARDLDGWIDVAAADPDASEEQGKSQVRDSEDGLEVIALFKDADGDIRLSPRLGKHGGALVPMQLNAGLDDAVARAMASCTLPLPLSMCHPGVIDRVLKALEDALDYSGWQDSPWVKGQLAVVFDAHGDAVVDQFHLHYDPHEGLTVVAEERV